MCSKQFYLRASLYAHESESCDVEEVRRDAVRTAYASFKDLFLTEILKSILLNFSSLCLFRKYQTKIVS